MNSAQGRSDANDYLEKTGKRRELRMPLEFQPEWPVSEMGSSKHFNCGIEEAWLGHLICLGMTR